MPHHIWTSNARKDSLMLMAMRSLSTSFDSIPTMQNATACKNGNAACLLNPANPRATATLSPEKISICAAYPTSARTPATKSAKTATHPATSATPLIFLSPARRGMSQGWEPLRPHVAFSCYIRYICEPMYMEQERRGSEAKRGRPITPRFGPSVAATISPACWRADAGFDRCTATPTAAI